MACKAGAPTDRAVVKSEDGRLYRNAGVRTETPLDLRQRGMKSDLCRVFAGASENAPFLLKQAEHRHVHCVGGHPDRRISWLRLRQIIWQRLIRAACRSSTDCRANGI